jgi:hypothetical protein
MVQQFPKGLLFLMLRVIHFHLLFPKDRLYRWDRLFRLLPMDPLCRLDLRHRMVPHLHLFRGVLMVRLFRRDRLPRLRREVLDYLTVPLLRWHPVILMGQQRRMLRQFHLALLFLLDPMFRLLRRVPLLHLDLLLLMVQHLH